MSLNGNVTVPFELPEIDYGLKEGKGLMKLWEKGIELEFEVSGFLGVFNSGVTTVRIAYSDLSQIAYKKGWFKDKITLTGTSMRVFEDVPGTDVATLTLKVKRGNREPAQSLVSTARMHFSEHKLGELDGDGS